MTKGRKTTYDERVELEIAFLKKLDEIERRRF